jgi:hypothetical protein
MIQLRVLQPMRKYKNDKEEKTEQKPVTHLPHFLMLKMIETLMFLIFELVDHLLNTKGQFLHKKPRWVLFSREFVKSLRSLKIWIFCHFSYEFGGSLS